MFDKPEPIPLETLAKTLQELNSTVILTIEKQREMLDLRKEFEEKKNLLVRSFMLREIAILRRK
jgi:hypothetical protein